MERCNEQKIELLRAEMINRYLEIGCLTDPRVVEISQELDVYLVEVQRGKNVSKNRE